MKNIVKHKCHELVQRVIYAFNFANGRLLDDSRPLVTRDRTHGTHSTHRVHGGMDGTLSLSPSREEAIME